MRRAAGGLASLLLTLAVLPARGQPEASPAADTGVEPGSAWLEYRLRQTVTNGGGLYEGWSDALSATGRYEFEGGALRARYSWTYASPEGERSGAEDRRVSFDPVSRRYLGRPIDLDEYDGTEHDDLAVWWRIPANVAAGDTVQILEEVFRVEGPTAPSEFTLGRPAILVLATGAGSRNDAYGDFGTTFEDRYWFDAQTGWFLAEERIEHDVGLAEGTVASFDVTTTLRVSGASYLPGTAASYVHVEPRVLLPVPEGGRASDWWKVLLAGVVGLSAVVWLVRWLRSRVPRHDYEGRIAPLDPQQEADLAALSPFFGELVPQLVRHAQPWGPVGAWGSLRLEGIALPAPPGEAATIFATGTACCEALRLRIGATHFFSEVRHQHSFAVRAQSASRGVPLSGEHAYNVLETHELLELSPLPSDVTYDRQVVRRGSAADVPAVVRLADAVYGGANAPWIQTALEHGDVLLVAVDPGAAGETTVGFALVTVVGSTARFSGLTVAEAHRGRGLGKELNRARLRIAHDLGATRAVVEVAAWNTASLEIARASGFRRAGTMYVETAAPAPSNQKFWRR
jgi:L-amino acid N-acyltransferase YncA